MSATTGPIKNLLMIVATMKSPYMATTPMKPILPLKQAAVNIPADEKVNTLT